MRPAILDILFREIHIAGFVLPTLLINDLLGEDKVASIAGSGLLLVAAAGVGG